MGKGAEILQILPRLSVHLAAALSLQQSSSGRNIAHEKSVDNALMNMIVTVLRIICFDENRRGHFPFLLYINEK